MKYTEVLCDGGADNGVSMFNDLAFGDFHDAIFAHLRGVPGVETTLASLRKAQKGVELNAALRGAKIFVEYNTNSGSGFSQDDSGTLPPPI